MLHEVSCAKISKEAPLEKVGRPLGGRDAAALCQHLWAVGQERAALFTIQPSTAATRPCCLPRQVCLLGCGISTGWGAVENTTAVKPGSSVAVRCCFYISLPDAPLTLLLLCQSIAVDLTCCVLGLLCPASACIAAACLERTQPALFYPGYDCFIRLD